MAHVLVYLWLLEILFIPWSLGMIWRLHLKLVSEEQKWRLASWNLWKSIDARVLFHFSNSVDASFLDLTTIGEVEKRLPLSETEVQSISSLHRRESNDTCLSTYTDTHNTTPLNHESTLS